MSSPEPQIVDSMELEVTEEGLIDLDFFGDESCIVVGFRGDHCALVNMRAKSVNIFDHRLPHPLVMVHFLKHFPSSSGTQHFFLMSKGGVYRAWNTDLRYMEVAKFHPSQFYTEYTRPLSLFLELENDGQDTLGYHQVPTQTTVAFPIQGKDVKHQIVVYRYMGVDHPQNGVRQLLKIEGQHIHSLTQIRTKYLAVSCDKELRIYDILTGQHLHSMKTQQPFQLLA